MPFPSFQHRDDFLKSYAQLSRTRRNWWTPFSQEGVLIKFIVGAFLLYIGSVVVGLVGIDFLLLLYTIFVVGTLWYALDLLRQQYSLQQRTYERSLAELNAHAQRWLLKKALDKKTEGGTVTKKRRLQAARSLLPYIWGISSDQWRQQDHFTLRGLSLSTLYIEQEGQADRLFWLVGRPLATPNEEESTAFLPRPYVHDKWERVRYNAAIELPDFQKDYQIFTSSFWHSYHLTRAALVKRFLALNQEPTTFLVLRRGWLYVAVPQAVRITASVRDWAMFEKEVQALVDEGCIWIEQVEKLIQY